MTVYDDNNSAKCIKMVLDKIFWTLNHGIVEVMSLLFILLIECKYYSSLARH